MTTISLSCFDGNKGVIMESQSGQKVEVRYIPIINKWEVIFTRGKRIVLIGRYSERQVAQEVASMSSRTIKGE